LPSNDSFTTIWSTLEKTTTFNFRKIYNYEMEINLLPLLRLALGYSQKKEDLDFKAC
jgi:hypothetical protein